ncbi:MAG TPA: DUF3857 and transglutaminase domain-containing protein [Candidatus Polarisedimenticolia bacterium]|nr:DUF3857 and transglutaminase domain-containing protein [Candidatus Polarisedimenticolia bacterium]
MARDAMLLGPSLVLLLALSDPSLARAAAKQAPASGDGFQEVTPEERALKAIPQDPEADAVILLKERNGKIVEKGADTVNVLDYHWRMKILTERGKEYAEIHIPAQKYSRVSNLRARTIKADGTVVPVAPDQIFEKVVLQVGDYKRTELVFNFPAVEPGAILEYRYDRHDNFLLYIDPWYFAGPEFTLRSKVTQAVLAGMGYAVLCDLCSGAKPEVTDWREAKAKGQLYSVEQVNLPGYREELMMPPEREVAPRLEMTLQSWKNVRWAELGRQDNLFTDWASVAKYADTHYQDTIKDGQGALKPIVEGWVKGVTDPQEKIKAISAHVQRDFRYIGWTYVIGYASKIDAVLKNKAADNEDKAVLLSAALRTIGVDSQIALVSGKNGGSLNPKFFSLSQFTHAIVALPQAGGSTQWIDPTVAYAPFGFVPWKDSGAEGLLIKSGQGEMITLPVKNELSTSRYRVTVKPRSDGKADLEVEAEFNGEDAISLREDLATAAETARLAYLQTWVARRRPGAALRSHALENLEDPDKPLRLKMTIEAPGLVTMADEVMLVRTCALDCEEANPISKGARQYPFYVDEGWNDDETVTIQPPEGMKVSQAPPPALARSAAASFSLSCLSQGDGGARCSHQFVARRNRWPATEQNNIRAMFDKIVEVDRTTVPFEKAGAASGGP